jgi:transposase, IS5 family
MELKAQLNGHHPLVKLAEAIDWHHLSQELAVAASPEGGRPALPVRLMVGLHYLKALYDESDESVVEKWVENPYWQYFCGETVFQHELPCHPTSLVKWRKRVGTVGVERMLQGVIKAAMQCQALPESEIRRVNVDTTVQEKAIAYPTDGRLYDKARRALVQMARQRQVKLRQSYVRLGKQALVRYSRYASARQFKRAKCETRKLKTWLGRVLRDVQRQLPEPDPIAARLLEIAEQIYSQQKESKNKCYSVHAPEVECIAKGKVNKRYEFGCKVVIATTSYSNWMVGIAAQHSNPYDGATLKPALKQVKFLTGVKPKQALVDQGFRGDQYHPKSVKVLVASPKQSKASIKQQLKRRNAIEPVIGHSKQDHALGRNFLKGQLGDCINALLVGCGFNLRKLYRFFLTQSQSSQQLQPG